MTARFRTVHVRVNDAATGQPTPARIHFSHSKGHYFAPLGRLTKFPLGDNEGVGGNVLLGGKRFAYIDGSCEIELPSCPLSVEIHKGLEYEPYVAEITPGRGQMTLRFALARWIDLRGDRWYSGDCEAYHLSPHGALLEGAAEDLAVVNLLVQETHVPSIGELPYGDLEDVKWEDVPEFPVWSNILAFSGQRPALERPGHLVVVNTQNCHGALGRLLLLNCHRIVFPLEIHAYPLTGEFNEDWRDRPLADWCDQCHRKGGLVITANLCRFSKDEGFFYSEQLADVVLGKADAVGVSAAGNSIRYIHNEWYPILNAGCRVPLAAGSCKHSNHELLGEPRTYARLQTEGGLTYLNWIEAVRAGRTFVTNGPLLFFTVDGQDPGAVIELASREQPVRIHAQARSWVPFDHLELIHNGEVFARAEATGSPLCASLDIETKLPAAGWLAVRCSSRHKLPHLNFHQEVGAHTSPVYVQVAGEPPPVNPAAIATLVRDLDATTAWVEKQGRYGNGRPALRVIEVLRSARDILTERVKS
jgi:hypothetical protein